MGVDVAGGERRRDRGGECHADRAADLLVVLIRPDATPASAWRTPVRPPIDIGTNASASPRPLIMNAGNRSAK
jgi:hypothetical protein